MAQAEERHDPIRQSAHVDCPPEQAFRLFTERFGEWWPLDRSSTSGEDAETCVIEPWEGGRIFERTRSGEEREWGTVTAWEPPGRLEFSWHQRGGTEGVVEVEFSVEADGSRVTLVHTGWQLAGVETCFGGFVAAQMMVAA